MERNIPQVKKQIVKIIFGLSTVAFALYYRNIYHEGRIDEICNEHIIVTKAFMERIQYTQIDKSEFINQLYQHRYYSEDEKKSVQLYMDMAYKYPIGATTQEKDDLIKQFGHETYNFCIAHKTHLSD